jgi:chromosome segregation ATPase/ribosomal protein L40E
LAVGADKRDREDKSEKELLVEKYVKKSLASEQAAAGAKYKICSKCGATIPHDMRKCVCGAEYSTVALRGNYTNPGKDDGGPPAADALVDEKFSEISESFDSAESDLEQIAEDIASAVKGDIKKREDKFQEATVSMQDTIMKLQQEISEIKDGFGRIAEDIAAEVRDEIRKHDEGKIQGIELRIKDTLDQLHADMKREGMSLKEEDTKIRGAKKELYEEVNKLMDHLKKNEKELMDKEKALEEKEAEYNKRKAELETTLAAGELELDKKRNETEAASVEREREESRLKAEIEKIRGENERLKSAVSGVDISGGDWKKEEARLKAEIDRLKSAVAVVDMAGEDTAKHAEIVKIQSKILVAILKEKPEVVLKVIKSMNITKEELKKLVT